MLFLIDKSNESEESLQSAKLSALTAAPPGTGIPSTIPAVTALTSLASGLFGSPSASPAPSVAAPTPNVDSAVSSSYEIPDGLDDDSILDDNVLGEDDTSSFDDYTD